MKSTIKVDYLDKDGNGLEPVINVDLIESDDVRDKLLKVFFEKLGHSSSWLKINVANRINSELFKKTNYTLTPIKPEDLDKESIEMSGMHTGIQDKEEFKEFLYRKMYGYTKHPLSTEKDDELGCIPVQKVIQWVNEYLEKYIW